MLYIVTGLPGACKTLYTLSQLFSEFKDRQIYTHNFDGLDHDHFKTIDLDDPERWFDVPAGAVIAIDEAQGIFPLRKAGSPVPEKCSKFETHRHDGHDVILITQDATILDVHIRKLAGKHIHCKRLFGTESSTIFEYNKFEPKPEDRNTIRKAVSNKVWTFDKSIYEHYHSAEVHTVKRKIPFRLLMVPVILVGSLVVLGLCIYMLAGLFDKDVELIESISASTESEESVDGVERVPGSPIEEWIFQNTPMIEGIPWTAPKYFKLTEAVTYPRPHCIIYDQDEFNPGKCQCYSQQMTKMMVDENVCREITINGWFDATKESKQRERESVSPKRSRSDDDKVVPLRRDRDSLKQIG